MMNRQYFELEDDVDLDGRWLLGGLSDHTGRELDVDIFTNGVPVDLGPPLSVSLFNEDTTVKVVPPLLVSLERDGIPLDFTFADFDLPIVTAAVADLLAAIAGADLQRIPVCVEGQRGKYEIINVASRVACIDTKRSKIQWYAAGNNVRPDLAGTPEMITKLVIDRMLVGQSHIFRPDGWDVVVIVSDALKSAFENSNVSGVRFRKV